VKILLDECIDRRFAKRLTEYPVETVSSMNWNGLKNGDLLREAMLAGFDVFVTVDRNLSFQQDFRQVKLCVVVLYERSNRLADLEPLAPALLELLPELKPGEVRRVPERK
jgi:hypothetical protein